MIKFFRHIRKTLINQNQMSKYLKYAIGEILLVVVGILLALQINNWNEGRKERQHQNILVTQLLEDAKIDSIFYLSRLELYSDQIETYDILKRYCSSKKKDSNLISMVFANRETPFMAAASESNVMSNKNEHSKITDPTIKKALRDYTISYKYISKANDLHTELVLDEGNQIRRNYDYPYETTDSIEISRYYALCDVPNITGIMNLCEGATINVKEQAERFIADNQKLINDCHAYLND